VSRFFGVDGKATSPATEDGEGGIVAVSRLANRDEMIVVTQSLCDGIGSDATRQKEMII